MSESICSSITVLNDLLISKTAVNATVLTTCVTREYLAAR